MKNQIVLKNVIGVCLIMLMIVMMSGCGANKAVSKSGKRGIIFEYQMPASSVLKYSYVVDAIESAEVRKKKIDVNSKMDIDFTINSSGYADKLYNLSVNIDAMTSELKYMGKEIDADMSSVIGKDFNMKLSSKGTNVDASEAAELKFDIAPGRTRDLVSSFKNLFPKLPDSRIKVGDSWKASDTIMEKTGEGSVLIVINSVNTLQGFEEINGKNCAKITADFDGTIEGSGKEGDAELTTTGTLEGNDIWYFAHDEGVFVKLNTEGTATTMTIVKGEKKMEIPGTRRFTYHIMLVD